MANIGELQREDLGTILNLGIKGLRPYIISKLIPTLGNDWPLKLRDALKDKQRENWDFMDKDRVSPEDRIDFQFIKPIVLIYRELLQDDFGKHINKLPTWMEEIAEVRNLWAHQREITEEDYTRTIDTLIRIFSILKMKELEKELKEIKDGKKHKYIKSKEVPGLTPWFQNVIPHTDIRQGVLDESVFAANLTQVVLGNARPIYQDMSTFLQKTYLTAGLKNLVKRVVNGLNGKEDAENRVISLQTGFGGGKTHALILLYHIINAGKKSKDIDALKTIISSIGNHDYEKSKVAIFTNSLNDPVQGRIVEGVKIKTLWGELSWQLGGNNAYKIIQENDEKQTAPKGKFREVLEKVQPALILIDELADYCVAASGVKVGSSNLADQTISFIQELSESVASVQHCMLVATLPASESEVASSSEGARILHSLSQRIGRVSSDTKPVEDEEIYEVIRRRLFEDIGDRQKMENVISHYVEMYNPLAQNNEIPPEAIQTSYISKMKKSYPFHPELIEMFRNRWASHHDFQRTRGVLRLLGSIVSDLWKQRHNLSGSQGLIHTSHIDFGTLDALSSQLKRLEGNGYEAVITADISGTASNAWKIDEQNKEYGQYSIAKGVVNTILLGSCGSSANKGVTLNFIKLCVLRPETFNHNAVNGVIDSLEERAFYLYYSTIGREKKYWFHTKPNINILINQAKEDIKENIILGEIRERLNTEAKRIDSFNPLVNPSEDIAEQKRLSLIILGPEHRANPDTLNSGILPYIKNIATRKGNQERIYRNTILFLICNELSYGRLFNKAKEFLACKKIEEEYRSQLTKEQTDELKKKVEQFSRETTQAIAETWSIVIKFRVKEGPEKLLITQFKDTLHDQVNLNLKQRLKDDEWVLDAVGFNLLKKHNLIPLPGKPVKVREVYEAFIRFDDKPMISQQKAITDSINKYCYNGELAIGSSSDGKIFDRMYYKENVPFLSIEEENFWLVDKSEYKTTETTGDQVKFRQTDFERGETEETKDVIGKPVTAKIIRSITISGKVPIENWSQIFTSFINPLKGHKVEIDIKITAKSTESNPMKENSPEVKIAKESAKQLGLDYKEE